MQQGLTEILARWEDAFLQGRELSAEEVCADCPERIDEVRPVIAAMRPFVALRAADERSRRDGPLPKVPCQEGAVRVPRVEGFEILGELGRGGMGVVYKARQLSLNRIVALKMILHAEHAGERDRLRLLAEAEAASAINHPGIVSVYQVGVQDGLPYAVLEYCDGGSLAALLSAGRPAPADAARLMAQVADAVHAAHQAGIVHRDLKPANILLMGNGEWGMGNGRARPDASRALSSFPIPHSPFPIPKVADFGLAYRPEGGARLTATGAVLGTPAYMAPEQARGQKVGPAADVWALGAILYELLTGQSPFAADSGAEILRRAQAEEPLPPRRLDRAIPRDLETVALKCLRKDPLARYGSAAEMAADLRAFLDCRPISARRAGPAERLRLWCRREPRLALASLAVALVLLALPALAVWFSSRVADESRKRHAQEELAQTHEFYRLLARVKERAARREPGWTWENRDDLRRAVRLPAAAENQAELRSEAAACLLAIDLRQSARVEPGFTPLQAAYSPDGKYLALSKNINRVSLTVALVDAQTGRESRRLTAKASVVWQLKAGGRIDSLGSLCFSPDGNWLLAGSRSGELHRWDMRQGQQGSTQWSAHDDSIEQLAFGRGGVLYSRSIDGVVKGWESSRGWRAAPMPPLEAHDLIAFPHEQAAVRRLANETFLLQGRAPSRTAIPDLWTLAAFDPSGHWVAHSGNGGLWLRAVYATAGRRLDAEAKGIAQHRFGPAGRLLARLDSGAQLLHLWDTGSGRVVSVVPLPLLTGGIAFHPGGRSLAVTDRDGAKLFDVAGTEHVAVLPLVGPGRSLATAGKTLAAKAEIAQARPTEAGLSEITAWDLGGPVPMRPPRRVAASGVGPDAGHLALTADGSSAFLAEQGRVGRWDLASGSRVDVMALDAIRGVHAGADRRLWVVSEHEVWSGRPPEQAPARRWSNPVWEHSAGLTFGAVVAGARHALAGRRDGRVFVFDAASGEKLRSPQVCRSAVLALAQDGRVALAGGRAGEVVLFDPATGAVLTELPTHKGAVTGVAFVAGLLASASQSGTVRLCRRDGEPVLTIRAGGPVLCLRALGSKLALIVEGEWAARVLDLGSLGAAMAEMGFDLGEGWPAATDPAPYPPAAPAPIDTRPRAANGLVAELFDGEDFQFLRKRCLDEGITPDANIAGDTAAPSRGRSVRWTGYLRVPAQRDQELTFAHPEAAQVYLDGKLARGKRGVYPVGKGRLLPLRIDLRLAVGGPNARQACELSWRPVGETDWHAVPAEALFPDRAAAEKPR